MGGLRDTVVVIAEPETETNGRRRLVSDSRSMSCSASREVRVEEYGYEMYETMFRFIIFPGTVWYKRHRADTALNALLIVHFSALGYLDRCEFMI
jgi:hypothetical protein